MVKNNIVLTPRDFVSIQKLTTVSIVTVTPLEFALADFANTPSSIEVMLQGVPFAIVAYTDIDAADNVGKFSIDTNNNLVFIVDSTKVVTEQDARNYIWGIAVIYTLKCLTVADNIPTYVCESFDTMGHKISETLGVKLADIMNKINCLDSNQDINEVGYYYHIVTRNMI